MVTDKFIEKQAGQCKKKKKIYNEFIVFEIPHQLLI